MSISSIQKRYELLSPFLNEKQRRLLAAAEAETYGHGGTTYVARATGMSRNTIAAGSTELHEGRDRAATKESGRIRRPGGGRKRAVDKDPRLTVDLENLIEPLTRGDPESPLRWTCKSVRTLTQELRRLGHQTSRRMVNDLLHQMDYSLQGNRKTLEGSSHPDRDTQFEYIHRKVKEFQSQGQPVISVDTKKKELVGNFRNAGRQWRPKGEPEAVLVHDFEALGTGKVRPYGVYDVFQNTGWVNVGVDHDTAAFAVESIRRWWTMMGRAAYPGATSLLITADSGGSNGTRLRLWKTELQAFSTDAGLVVSVCHFPPGTSKWNKIEHRLFSYISLNWRGKPLVSHEVIVNLIASTTTTTGLRVSCGMDYNTYPTGIKVTDKDLKAVHLIRDAFHGEWNYTIMPKSSQNGHVIS